MRLFVFSLKVVYCCYQFDKSDSEMEDSCLICKRPLRTEETVQVSKGLNVVVESSVRRRDSIHLALVGKTSIELHVTCRRNDTRSSSIEATIKSQQSATSASSASSSLSSSSLRRSTTTRFDFRRQCLFCGKEATFNATLPASRRKVFFFQIRTLGIKERILKYATSRNDRWGDEVRARVLSENDLVAARGRYHRDCYAEFTRVRMSHGVGRPAPHDWDGSFKKVTDYLDSLDECQHNLEDLASLMDVKSEKPYYVRQKLMKMLRDKYGDRAVFAASKNNKTFLCMKHNVGNILTDYWYISGNADPSEERKSRSEVSISEKSCRGISCEYDSRGSSVHPEKLFP